VFEIKESKEASKYVVRGSLSGKEIIPATLRALRSGVLLACFALALLFTLLGWPQLAFIALLASLAVSINAVRGQVRALGLYINGEIIGGVRWRQHKSEAKIMGLYVKSSQRGKSLGTALVYQAMLEIEKDLPEGRVLAFYPTHPASKKIVDNYWGQKSLAVNSAEFKSALERLRKASP
jgi:hypothetical protein